MPCYKDQTFCNSDCKNKECFRFYGPEQMMGARFWWSHDPDHAPIAFSDFSAKCEGYKK